MPPRLRFRALPKFRLAHHPWLPTVPPFESMTRLLLTSTPKMRQWATFHARLKSQLPKLVERQIAYNATLQHLD